MTPDEKVFCQALGARIAVQRKQQGLTQQQLANMLGISQQHVASYEVGRRRIAVTLLPKLIKALNITMVELIVETPLPSKRGPTPRLQQQIERVRELPRAKQRFVMEMIDTVIQQAAN